MNFWNSGWLRMESNALSARTEWTTPRKPLSNARRSDRSAEVPSPSSACAQAQL